MADEAITPKLASLLRVQGHGVSFWLGHRYHEGLRACRPLKAHPELSARGQAHFAERGSNSGFLGRLLGPVSAIVPVVAGISDRPELRFAVVNVRSAIAWPAAHLVPGAGARLSLSAMSYRHARPRRIAVEQSPPQT